MIILIPVLALIGVALLVLLPRLRKPPEPIRLVPGFSPVCPTWSDRAWDIRMNPRQKQKFAGRAGGSVTDGEDSSASVTTACPAPHSHLKAFCCALHLSAAVAFGLTLECPSRPLCTRKSNEGRSAPGV